jgi:hypothetical protein
VTDIGRLLAEISCATDAAEAFGLVRRAREVISARPDARERELLTETLQDAIHCWNCHRC